MKLADEELSMIYVALTEKINTMERQKERESEDSYYYEWITETISKYRKLAKWIYKRYGSRMI